MNELHTPLSNVQLELLKLFASNVPEEDLEVIRQILIRYKAERIMDQADAEWERLNWTNERITELLSTHMRTPYHRAADK